MNISEGNKYFKLESGTESASCVCHLIAVMSPYWLFAFLLF